MAPLNGLLVVAMEQAVAAPYCSSRLADAGARVIKIERESGDFARHYDRFAGGQSAYFVWLNRGKESLIADIKDAGDRALLHRMIDRADVFIQNLAPRAAARAGFDSAGLRRRNARLITLDISGYGEAGDYADMKAYDLLVQAESGLCSVTGAAAAPGRVGVSVMRHRLRHVRLHGHPRGADRARHLRRGVRNRHVPVRRHADWMTVPAVPLGSRRQGSAAGRA